MASRCYQISRTVCADVLSNRAIEMGLCDLLQMFVNRQSTPASYEHYTRECLTTAEAARQRSANLRSTLSAIYTNSIKDLRDQAMRVDMSLGEKIKLTEEVRLQLEKELLRVSSTPRLHTHGNYGYHITRENFFQCLYEQANSEKAIEELRHSVRGLDCAMKVAQTRLADRLHRRNVESCRDTSQFA